MGTRLPWDGPRPEPQTYEEHGRKRSPAPYHTSRWTKLSRAFRADHPLCAECQRKGIIKPAQVVDHIIPWPVCGDFFDTTNFQSLCEECNVLKGNRDKKIIAKSNGGRKIATIELIPDLLNGGYLMFNIQWIVISNSVFSLGLRHRFF